jgi:hypothetical protein
MHILRRVLGCVHSLSEVSVGVTDSDPEHFLQS